MRICMHSCLLYALLLLLLLLEITTTITTMVHAWNDFVILRCSSWFKSQRLRQHLDGEHRGWPDVDRVFLRDRLKEFVETCTQTVVLEQVIVVAVETVGRVHKMVQQAQTGGVVNGWGLYELKELWNEICKMGTECARPPCTGAY